MVWHHISVEWSPEDSCCLVFPMVLRGALSTCMQLSPLRSCTKAQKLVASLLALRSRIDLSPFGICDRQSGPGTGFSPGT